MMCSTVLTVIAATLAVLPAAQTGRSATAPEGDSARLVGLAIAPAKFDSAAGPSLLFEPNELTDGDGAELYAEAAQALPQAMNGEQIRRWLAAPLSELPQTQVNALLQQARASLELTSRGAGCDKCDWPPFQPGTMPANLSGYRDLARLLCLRARLEVAQKRYDNAIETIRTGLAMARHIGEGPTVVQGTVGVAIAAMVLRCVEDLAQASGSANLHAALGTLPQPLIDVERPISSELKSLDANRQYGQAVRNMMRRQMEAGYERVRQLMCRLDATVAALQCIEALRDHAATHNGSLPARLEEIQGVEVPAGDQIAFVYRLDGSKAVLEVAPPKGGRPRDAVRYEITVAR